MSKTHYVCLECGAGLLPKDSPDTVAHFRELHSDDDGHILAEHAASQMVEDEPAQLKP